jgi:hypothetical protein
MVAKFESWHQENEVIHMNMETQNIARDNQKFLQGLYVCVKVKVWPW